MTIFVIIHTFTVALTGYQCTHNNNKLDIIKILIT